MQKADVIAVSLKRNDSINHMFKRFWTGNRSFLRNVCRHYKNAVALLHPADKLVRAVFKLVHRTGNNSCLSRIHCLN